MGANLDLDDVAETSDFARAELMELRELVWKETNPRHLLWRVWHGDNQNMRSHDYIAWSGERWAHFCASHQRNRQALTTQDHADYDAWLLGWVRREIAAHTKEQA